MGSIISTSNETPKCYTEGGSNHILVTECDGQHVIDLAKQNKDYIFHIKGFANGLSYSLQDRSTKKAVKDEIISKITGKGKHVIVIWDGDDYSDASFTRIVYKIMNYVSEYNIKNRVHFVAAKKKGEIEKFKESWSGILDILSINVHILAMDDNIGWDQLGIKALEASQSKNIICIGGGETINNEYKYFSNKEGVRREWKYFNMWRKNASGVAEYNSIFKDNKTDISITRYTPDQTENK